MNGLPVRWMNLSEAACKSIATPPHLRATDATKMRLMHPSGEDVQVPSPMHRSQDAFYYLTDFQRGSARNSVPREAPARIPLRLSASGFPLSPPAPSTQFAGHATYTEITRHDCPDIDRDLIIAPASFPPTIFSVTQSSRPTATALTPQPRRSTTFNGTRRRPLYKFEFFPDPIRLIADDDDAAEMHLCPSLLYVVTVYNY